MPLSLPSIIFILIISNACNAFNIKQKCLGFVSFFSGSPSSKNDKKILEDYQHEVDANNKYAKKLWSDLQTTEKVTVERLSTDFNKLSNKVSQTSCKTPDIAPTPTGNTPVEEVIGHLGQAIDYLSTKNLTVVPYNIQLKTLSFLQHNIKPGRGRVSQELIKNTYSKESQGLLLERAKERKETLPNKFILIHTLADNSRKEHVLWSENKLTEGHDQYEKKSKSNYANKTLKTTDVNLMPKFKKVERPYKKLTII